MENGTSNLPQSSEADASQSHPAKSPRQVSVEAFEALLTMLGVSRHIDVVQLFVGRIPYQMVQDWRRGRCAIPQWAWGYLATLCRQRANVLLRGVEIGNNPPYPSRGQGSHRNIAKWNARRAAEKKKASESAGPKSNDLIGD